MGVLRGLQGVGELERVVELAGVGDKIMEKTQNTFIHVPKPTKVY